MISIDTKRLHLRNISQNDVQAMFDNRNNEICSRYQRGQIKDFEEIPNLIERRKNDEISIDSPCMIAVALKETNELIGEIIVKPKDNTISLGYKDLGYVPSMDSKTFGKWTTLVTEEKFV